MDFDNIIRHNFDRYSITIIYILYIIIYLYILPTNGLITFLDFFFKNSDGSLTLTSA